MNPAIDQIRGGLVVSCQAPSGHPLRDCGIIARLAQCAQLGGAVGLRINGPDDIRATLGRVTLPIIGLNKTSGSLGRDIITPGFDFAEPLAHAGAQVIAIEVTDDVSPGQLHLIAAIHERLDRPVMADVDTLEHGLAAWDAGADLVGTTMSGYTVATRSNCNTPDLNLVAALASHGVRTIAEGRYATNDQVSSAFDVGAWAVVIGTAITNPVAITRRFTWATPAASTGEPN